MPPKEGRPRGLRKSLGVRLSAAHYAFLEALAAELNYQTGNSETTKAEAVRHLVAEALGRRTHLATESTPGGSRTRRVAVFEVGDGVDGWKRLRLVDTETGEVNHTLSRTAIAKVTERARLHVTRGSAMPKTPPTPSPPTPDPPSAQ